MSKNRRKFSKKTKIILAVIPIVLVFASAFLAQKIYAYSGDNEFNANGIKYYDPDNCSPDGGGSSTKLPGNTLEEKVWNYLSARGFNDAQVAGIMGNFEAESGMNPVRQSIDNSSCWGIAQICTSSGQYEASRQAFIDAGLGKYLGPGTEWSGPDGGEKIPAEDLDTVIDIMLSWILKICDENRYIYDGTYTEWIKTAQTPEEAAEIFMVTYERAVCTLNGIFADRCFPPEHIGSMWDQNYDGYQDLDKRRVFAREFFEQYAGTGTTASSTSSSLGSSTGANVTIIGDSITNGAQDSIKEKLPDADIRSKVSKHMFMDASDEYGGDSGATILADIVQKNELRDVLIIALGTNDPGALSVDEIQSKIVDKALNEGHASKIIFVNNSETRLPEKYAQNNEVLNAVASQNPNVSIADWAGIIKKNPTLLSSDETHPTAEGSKEFAKLMYESVGALSGSQSSNSSGCNCATGGSTGSGDISGGLTDEQAQSLANDYNEGEISRWSTPGNEQYDVLNNCVSFSKYIIRVMTDLEWGGGHGRDVVKNLVSANAGLESGNEPKPFSIFSTENHTGFIVAVNGDDVLAVESAWPYAENPQGYNGKLRHYDKSTLSSGYTFAYIQDHLDSSKFGAAIGSSAISTTSTDSSAIVNASWQDGWITQGIEGYKKEYFADMGVTPIDSSYTLNYSTNSPKNGTTGPNKILLHSVEGRNESSGIAVYNRSNAPLSHFTVDLKNKKTYQHLPINKPACGVATYDTSSGVQIEIMGFSTSASAGFSEEWYLENDDSFGDAEWAYLAKLLVAISDETGIPLTSDLDWSKVSRMDGNAYVEYEGVVGHRHVPENSHTDPGNIWDKVSEQLSKITSGNTNGSCNGSSSWSGKFPFMFQCEGEWAAARYARGDYCDSGCGITSAAMTVSAITGQLVKPTDLNQKRSCDTTVDSSCLLRWAEDYGFEGVSVTKELNLGTGSSDDQIVQGINKYLKNGYIIIIAGRRALGRYSEELRNPFSDSGHYVVFYGIDGDGKWLIADPAGTGRSWSAKCTDIGECEPNDNAMEPYSLIPDGIQRGDGTGTSIYAFRK